MYAINDFDVTKTTCLYVSERRSLFKRVQLTDDREIEDGVGVTEDNSVHRPEFHPMNEPIRIGVAVDVIAHLFVKLVIDLELIYGSNVAVYIGFGYHLRA